MERLIIIEADERYDCDYYEEKYIKENEIEEIFTDDKDRIDDDCHLLIGMSKNSENFYYRNPSEIVIDDEISIRDERGHNNEDIDKANNITS